MIVTCNNIGEFLENLTEEKIDDVLQKVVRVSVSHRELSEVVRMVTVQASAVIAIDAEGQYLLQVGQDCGKDVMDMTRKYDGTKEATRLCREIRAFCDEKGLVVRPGMITI